MASAKEVKKSPLQKFRHRHRISLFLFPVLSFATLVIFSVYGPYAPLGWLYGLVFLMLTTLIFIAEGTK